MRPPSHHIWLFLGIGTILAAGLSAADKLGDQPKVSIQPRTKTAAPGESTKLPRANIRVDSTLVLIPVTVTDPLNRFVTGLDSLGHRDYPKALEAMSDDQRRAIYVRAVARLGVSPST